MSRSFASILLFLTILSLHQDASRTLDVGDNHLRTSPSEQDSMTSANVSTWDPSTESADPLEAMSINWNNVIDYFITLLRGEVLSRDSDEIDIPDIDYEFFGGSGVIRGQFHATGGRLGYLSSLYRVGDVTVTLTASPAYRVTCAVGLRVVRMHYDQYDARLWGHGPRGDITGAVGDNTIQVAVIFHVAEGGECTAELEEVRVTELDEIEVRVTGMGFLNGFASRVASAQLVRRKAVLVQAVEEKLSREMTNILEGFRCDEYFGMFEM